MGMIFDQCVFCLPDEIPTEDRYESCGVEYVRIPGFEDYYISSDGSVISYMSGEPRIMKPWTNAHGHEYVELSARNGEKKKVLVHRLMAEVFMSNPERKPIVRHLNDIPDDNRLDNLAWGTQKDNRNDCVINGHDFRRPVYCFETKTVYRSATEAAKALDVHKSSIRNCCSGEIGQTNGYHFCYESDMDICLNDSRWLRERVVKPVVAISPEGNRKIFKSRMEAAKTIGINSSGITNVLAGRIQHVRNWRFEEVMEE